MAVSPRALKAAGCTPAKWRPLFTALGSQKLPVIRRIEDLIAARLSDGQLLNLRDWRMYEAIDIAYDASFRQTTPTIINSIMGRNFLKQEDLLAEIQKWDIKPEEVFLQAQNERTGQMERRINYPTFYKVLIPLVKSYVTVRWAKLFNDRNQNPLFKYEAMRPNTETRLICEVLTYWIQVKCADFGYPNDLKDAIFKALMYSCCLMFPREVWFTEYQSEMAERIEMEEVITKSGATMAETIVEYPRRKLVKEGLRYVLPKPSQFFWDLHYPISSFNSDTGCEYAGYWKVVSYGDIIDNGTFWNRKSIGYSSRNWNDPITSSFLDQIFPCNIDFPTPAGLGDGTNREQMAAYYSTSERDKAVFQTDLFMKMVPSKWGLGDYKYPIWIRFIVASDNTVLYAEPMCYCPVVYFGYDADPLRGKNPSMALEILPFQDNVGNTLSQILLTVKQNLLSFYFYDRNVVKREDVDKMLNLGETLYRGLNMQEFDSFKNQRSGFNVKEAVIPVNFQYKDPTPLINSLNTQLTMLDRLLQLSAQETGAAASHQQSAEEIQQISGNTSNRVEFTGTFIDDGIDAWKRQQVAAHVAYADEEIDAFVSNDFESADEVFKRMGFKVDDDHVEGKIHIQASKSKLKFDDFVTSSDTPQRKNDAATAQIMLNAIGIVAKDGPLAQMVGPKALLKGITQAAKLAGADPDFNLKPDFKTEVNELQKLAQQISDTVAKKVEGDVTQPVAKQIAQMNQQIQSTMQALDTVQKAVVNLAHYAHPAGQPVVPPPTNVNPQNIAPNPAPAGTAVPTLGV